MPIRIPEKLIGYREVKRVSDIISSLLAILLLLPLFPIILLAIKLDSLGPVFSHMVRIGRHGKSFKAIKFRTMCLDAEATGTGPVFKLQCDTRITRVGRFLRQTALDELPMLYNVLCGDMSLVGPRAALPLEIEHYSKEQLRRLDVRPGITGYWQVFGRSSANDLDKMIKMDLEYVDKESIWLDLKIIFRTISVAFSRRGAY